MKHLPFKFWVPINEISKGKDSESGAETMILAGLASTADEDTDNETLVPEGFDISYLKERGFINWNHKKDPDSIIGEPIEAVKKKEGLYVKAQLYPDSELAKKVYKFAQTLKKNSKLKRRLGFSIEGKALERDSLNPNRVLKALVTGVAITPSPKNSASLIDIIKGNVDLENTNHDEPEENELNEFDANGGNETVVDVSRPDGTNIKVTVSSNLKKEMDTETGAPLIREHLDKKMKNQVGNEKELTKAEIYDRIFQLDSVISLEKAHQIYDNINKFAMKNNKDNKPKVTSSVLEKAMANLGLAEETKPNDILEKSVEDDESSETVEEGQESTAAAPESGKLSKAETGKPAPAKKATPKPAAATVVAEETVEENPHVATLIKGITDEVQEIISKALGTNASTTDRLIKSVGILVADSRKQVIDFKGEVTAKFGELEEENKLLKFNLNKALEEIEKLGGTPQGIKSVTRAAAPTTAKPVERKFEKSNDAESAEEATKRAKTLSVSQNNKEILNILDGATFEKGMDTQLADDMLKYEASKTLTPYAQQAIRARGYNLVK